MRWPCGTPSRFLASCPKIRQISDRFLIHCPELDTKLTRTKQIPDTISNRQYFALLKLPDTLFRPQTALGYRYGFHRRHPRSASVGPDRSYRAEGVRSTPLPSSRAREFLIANELKFAALIFEPCGKALRQSRQTTSVPFLRQGERDVSYKTQNAKTSGCSGICAGRCRSQGRPGSRR
jgi:hypothetical protein